MNQMTLTADVNYDDLLGTVAADHHDRNHLSDLAGELGIDTNRYFVFGIHARFNMENRDDLKAELCVDILAVDSKVIGASFDSIRDYMNKNNGKLPYIAFETPATFREILTAFKRFDLVLTMKLGPFQNAFEQDKVDLTA